MRTTNRSLVLVLAFLVSAVAAPTYASDDSPGLLDAVEETVDSLTAPSESPTPALTSAGPVTQLTTVVDSALGGQTSLNDLSLVSTVDEVLAGGAAVPTSPAPETEVPADGDDGSLLEPAASVAGDDQVLASRPLTAVIQLDSFSAAVLSTGKKDAERAHVPGTSTLPDGGSPLTLAWLVLWLGVVGAGGVILRRSRA